MYRAVKIFQMLLSTIHFFPLLQEEKASTSSTSVDLTASIGDMKIADESSFLSPDTTSTVSSSGDGSSTSKARPRDSFNGFLNQCQIQPLGKPWLEWGEISIRTRQRYIQQSGENVSTVLKVISPSNAPHLWEALQTSDIVNQ